jgi:peptidoglycan/LPS O-acetylase OafA/YrhL
MTAPKPRAIIALDLLRFASALLVVAFHYGAAFALAPSPAARAMLHGLPVSAALAGESWFGWVGVELFFMMSGFVIALSGEGTSGPAFLRRRALRLLPAAWICASATLLVLALWLPALDLWRRWLIAVTFWPSADAIDPSYWTLPIEVCFYLLIATGLRASGTLGAIERRARVIGLISTVFWLVMLCLGSHATALVNARLSQVSLAQHGCFFALGVTAWAMLSERPSRMRVALFALFALTGLVEIAAIAVERTRTLGIDAGPLLPMLTFAIGVAVMLGSLQLQPLLLRGIGTRTAATLGRMTYPLYLIHQQVGAAVTAMLLRAGLPFIASIALTLVAALGFAWWVATIAEPRVRARLARLLTRRRAPAQDTLPSAFLPSG